MKAESAVPLPWSWVCVAVATAPGFSVMAQALPVQVPPAAVHEGSHPPVDCEPPLLPPSCPPPRLIPLLLPPKESDPPPSSSLPPSLVTPSPFAVPKPEELGLPHANPSERIKRAVAHLVECGSRIVFPSGSCVVHTP